MSTGSSIQAPTPCPRPSGRDIQTQLHQKLPESCSVLSRHSISGFKTHIYGKGILLYQNIWSFLPRSKLAEHSCHYCTARLDKDTTQITAVPLLHVQFETESPKVKVKTIDFYCKILILCLSWLWFQEESLKTWLKQGKSSSSFPILDIKSQFKCIPKLNFQTPKDPKKSPICF